MADLQTLASDSGRKANDETLDFEMDIPEGMEAVTRVG